MSKSKKPSGGITLYQSNNITEAKYEFTLLEKKAFLLVLNKIREAHIDTDTTNRDLFHNLIVEFRPKDVQFESGKPSDIYNALEKLMGKLVKVRSEEYDFTAPLLSSAHHFKKEGYFRMTASADLIYHIVDVAKQYTAYSFDVAMSFKSIYTVRFYEWLNQWKSAGGLKLSIKEIKERLMIEKKYTLYGDLKRYVIDIAHKEMKSLFDEGMCDLCFEYTEYKEGRSVAGLSIKIITKQPIRVEIDKPKKDLLTLTPDKEFDEFTSTFDLYNDLNLLTESPVLVEGVLKFLQPNKEKLKKFYDEIKEAKKHYNKGVVHSPKAYIESIVNKYLTDEKL